MLHDADAFSSFSVHDVERAKEFYGTTLGLDVSPAMGGLELHLGKDHRVFVYPKEDHKPATFTVLNFPVDDLEKAYDDLVGRGVSFGYRNDADLGTDERGIHWGREKGDGPNIAWFKDPDGNVLSVIEG